MSNLDQKSYSDDLYSTTSFGGGGGKKKKKKPKYPRPVTETDKNYQSIDEIIDINNNGTAWDEIATGAAIVTTIASGGSTTAIVAGTVTIGSGYLANS